MRRLWTAALALAFALPACGPSPEELKPGLIEALQDLSTAVIRNDEDKLDTYVLARAGQHDPVGAKDLDTPEGRARIQKGNRHWVRTAYKDAGIVSEKDIPTFMSALHIGISGIDAQVTFEIAGSGRRAAEIVTFNWTKTDKGWRMIDYFRDFKMQ
jgi:hypothetical protein